MKTSKLFALLPDYVSTPDGMAVTPDGNHLIVACPNFADPSMPGCLIKFDREGNVKKWVDVPILKETGAARPMGIAFGPDGDIYICDNQPWLHKPEMEFKGRILRLRIIDDKLIKTTVVAYGMEHPNGLKIWGDSMYVTQTFLTKVKDPSGLPLSCVYKFGLEDEGIEVTNTLADKNILTTFLTRDHGQWGGADGIVFDREGNLYVGVFGDGAVSKVVFNPDGSVKENKVWAKDPDNLTTTDGMDIDNEGNIYIADFGENAIAKVYPDGKVERLAQSPDCDGFNGELDQPGEPCFWDGRLIVSCFDAVKSPLNSAHEMPATMAYIEL